MFKKINGINTHFKVLGEGTDVLLLHGWGANLTTLSSIQIQLAKYFKTYAIDLPGFGQSDQPPAVWNSKDYAEFIASFIQEVSIKCPILIGHSFGGKISIQLAATNQVKKLVLIDSSGIKSKRKISSRLKVFCYKKFKNFLSLRVFQNKFYPVIQFFKNKFGSSDYKNASGIMRKILVTTVNEDLKNLLPCINVPTLLIWGENDQDTPLSDGKLMNDLIPNSGLVILKKAGHYSYLDQFQQFIIILKNFLNKP